MGHVPRKPEVTSGLLQPSVLISSCLCSSMAVSLFLGVPLSSPGTQEAHLVCEVVVFRTYVLIDEPRQAQSLLLMCPHDLS